MKVERSSRRSPRADGRAHPFLRVNFDTRVYNDGQARVDVSVENMLDQMGATTVTYDVTVVVNGRVVFSRSAVQHSYLTRWRKVFDVGSRSLAAVTPDISPFTASRALPPYLSLVTNRVSTPTGANYDILREGALTANMPAHGGQDAAPFPDWTARYLVHKDARQRAFVLANGDLSGSWPVHVREADGQRDERSGVGTVDLAGSAAHPVVRRPRGIRRVRPRQRHAAAAGRTRFDRPRRRTDARSFRTTRTSHRLPSFPIC